MKKFVVICTVMLGLACQKEDPASIESKYVLESDLSESSWVVTRYDNTNTTNSYFPEDTLHFLNDTVYQINQGSFKTYTLRDWSDNGQYDFKLEDCTTLGDTYFCTVSASIVADGELNNIRFWSNSTNTVDVMVWMERL